MARKIQYIDRRKHKRVDLYCLVKYRYLKQGGEESVVITSLRNISGGGLLFRSDGYLPLDTKLEIFVNLLPVNRIISASGRVVRFEKISKTGHYLIGVEFTKISDEDRDAIIRFAKAKDTGTG